jgi:single-strand DNA-binding protein
MASYNKVILLGNLTRDPELRYTPKGTAVANIGIAVYRKWKNDSGEMQEEVTFVDVTAFGRTAENVGQYLRKGSPLHLEGRLSLDQWEDRETGQKRSKLKVVADSIQFLSTGDRDSGGGDRENQPHQGNKRDSQHRSGSRPPSPRPTPPPNDDMPPPEGDDGIPF